MLKLPAILKMNLKFSAWLMSKVSVKHRAIILLATKILKFWADDVHKVFGIPCGHRNVRGRDGFINPEAIQFIKNTLGMDKTGAHSLKAAEQFLLRDISESSSKLEKDCFQIAFVIFVMGHVLAPTTKHDYGTIDYWGALADTESISQFNWCEYVLECLMEVVRRLKNDMTAGNMSTNLVGCHLWLHVFFLDNVDLGMFNKKHDVLPRISDFDQATMKNMISMSTDIGTSVLSFYNCKFRHDDDVCYTRRKHPECDPKINIQGAGFGNDDVCIGDDTAAVAMGVNESSPNLEVQTPLRALGPIDFAQHLQRRYPSMASHLLSILLREQNARCQREINTARANTQADMIKFVDKLMDLLSTRCICCTARGFTNCPARAVDIPTGAEVLRTPAGPKISGVRLDMSACSDGNPTLRTTRDESTSHQQEKRQRTAETTMIFLRDQIECFAKHVLQQICELFIDLPNDGSTTVFGERTNGLPGRKYVYRPGFQTGPWTRGVIPYPPTPAVKDLLVEFFATSSAHHLSRNFLVHEKPRFIRISGVTLKEQLVGDAAIDHELMSIIIRRYSQADQEADKESPYLSWRHPIEPEFSTFVLSDFDYLHTKSIQNQLCANELKYDITSSQLFFTPVPRPEGWMVVFWDMIKRFITVIDPLYTKQCPQPPTQQRDEIIAWKLHYALFHCLNEYYAGWPTSKHGWTVKFMPVSDNIVTRHETGACIIHIARQFDGEKLKLPITKESSNQRSMVAEIIFPLLWENIWI
ncbi:uncharacterized protein [Aegilops tauschii subsp. strangulata]|uniref:Aminotransferase-like plant mobile domain-containing protein n=1 Tax=Aegilops tauschii subsp. strangulata TaxID=200361 RepID=A0A452ZXV5_AEGTS|nr:uncharacterized protein LOC120966053 isoform X4 [Aegilops tauschii subsp. strangulata]